MDIPPSARPRPRTAALSVSMTALSVPVLPRPVGEPRLVGRAGELDALGAFVDAAATRGGALVLRGDTGCGRTALLGAASRDARERGATVMVVRGGEVGGPAGLVRWLRTELRRLGDPRWHDLSVAEAADRGRIGPAMLTALRAAGRARAVLVVADDLPDLDPAVAATLAFVARRLTGCRVGFLAAVRTDDREPAGLPELTVLPLTDADATRLVREHAPGLPGHVVRRVVAEAGGNPSALRELAAPAARPPEPFASRVRDLPGATRSALLVAALAGPVPLGGGADPLAPAERAGLVDVDPRSGAVRFRHPLLRPTVLRLAPPDEHRAAHRMIADLLVDRADPHHGSPSAASARAHGLLHRDGDVVGAHRLLDAALVDPRDPAVVDGLHLLADPARVSAQAAASLDAAIRGLGGEPDPVRIIRIAAAGFAIDRVAECREPLRRVLAGRATPAAMVASALLAAGDVATGRWDEAGEVAEEGIALCERHDHHLAAAPLRLQPALIAAARGDEVRTRALVDRVLGRAAPRGVRAVVEEGHRVLALSALGRGDAADAHRHATAITPPGRLAVASPAALRVSLDLVDAAVRLGRSDEAREHARAMREAPVHAVSTRFAMLTAAAAALVAAPAEAEALFEVALGTPGASRWPFDQARIQLAGGEHLRRLRRVERSRVLLDAALDTFVRLGARPWAARARHGLRATGVTLGRPVAADGAVPLTPDERTVAALAATGLTNKQIARQLRVSHHTVAARLYQAFPKLGVGSRAALRGAMLTAAGKAADRPA